MELVKASLTHLGNMESFTALWNPERYTLSRRSRVAAPDVLGRSVSPVQLTCGGVEEFTTDLLLDSSRSDPGARDLRSLVDKLESWMDPPGPGALPERLLFSWGNFRFRGILVSLDQVWVRFDPDGTPVRGWLRLRLRR
ncbi:MAG: hypothetical protein O7J95_09885 [Planctomycetota bacterium]|nr:hypothetical protein [Planctomycetota bacterium]